MEAAVEACARPTSVLERDGPRAFEGTGGRDAEEHALERPARQRRPDDVVLLCCEQQGQRRRTLAQVGAGDLAGLDRVARAVEDVVRDLERDPEVEARSGRASRPSPASTLPRRAWRSSASSARGTRAPSCPGRGAAAAASPRRGRGRDTRRRALRPRCSRLRRRARRKRARRDSRPSHVRHRGRARPRQPLCRAGSAHRRSGRRGRARPCGRARPRHRPRPDASVPGAAERNASNGRSRLPPAASASPPTSATRPPCEHDSGGQPLLDLCHVLVDAGERDDRFERRHAAFLAFGSVAWGRPGRPHEPPAR